MFTQIFDFEENHPNHQVGQVRLLQQNLFLLQKTQLANC